MAGAHRYYIPGPIWHLTHRIKQMAESVRKSTGVSFSRAYQLMETILEIIKTTLAGGEEK